MMRDRFTGLVRFLHRDYDPTVGRFTASDPLGDTDGDHDLYDYCVDEPVGRVDPEGTVAFLLPLLAGLGGMGGATGLAWGAVKAAQKGAEIAAGTLGDETLKAELPEKVEAMDKGTTDALTRATAINAGIGAAATAAAAAPTLARGAVKAAKAAPEAIAAAAGKGAEMAGKVGDAVANAASSAGNVMISKALDPKFIEKTTDFTSGLLIPTTPPASGAGYAGAFTNEAVNRYDLPGLLKAPFQGSKEKVHIEE